MGSEKLATVRKLLAKAERAATAAESEIYTAKAVELMARHGIDAALLAAAEPGRDEIGPLRIAMQDPYSAGKARLLGWTAAALGCKWVLHGAWGGKAAAVTVFGHASDRERVEVLYTSLLLQATTQLARARPPWPGESVAAYRRSWLEASPPRCTAGSSRPRSARPAEPRHGPPPPPPAPVSPWYWPTGAAGSTRSSTPPSPAWPRCAPACCPARGGPPARGPGSRPTWGAAGSTTGGGGPWGRRRASPNSVKSLRPADWARRPCRRGAAPWPGGPSRPAFR